MSSYPNSTVRNIHLSFPDTRVQISSQQYLDPNKIWTQADFDKQSQNVMRDTLGENPVTSKPKSLDFSNAKATPSENKGLVRAEKSDYFKHVVDKMMDFASSKYALANSNYKSDEFNQFYQESLGQLRQCSNEADKLRKQISDMLGSSKDKVAEIEGFQRQLDDNGNKIRQLQTEFDSNTGRLTREITALDDEIRDAQQKALVADVQIKARYDRVIVEWTKRLN
jgi:chromosome segregation ATPase